MARVAIHVNAATPDVEPTQNIFLEGDTDYGIIHVNCNLETEFEFGTGATSQCICKQMAGRNLAMLSFIESLRLILPIY
jgi:hypothetical protein